MSELRPFFDIFVFYFANVQIELHTPALDVPL